MFFNLKAALHSGVLFLPFSFNFYRIHAGQEQNNKNAYLSNNYNYLRDAFHELDFPFTKKEKDWILNKNRRRFMVNLFHHFWMTKDLTQTMAARRSSRFGMTDIFKGLFHSSIER